MKRTLTRPQIAILVALVATALVVAGGMAVTAQESPVEQTPGENTVDTADRQQTSSLRIVHASPDAPEVNVTLNAAETGPDGERDTPVETPTDGERDTPVDDEIGIDDPFANETDDALTTAEPRAAENATTTLTGLSYGDDSEYHQLTAGEYDVTVTTAGENESTVFEETVSLDPRTAHTFTVSADLIENDTSETAIGPDETAPGPFGPIGETNAVETTPGDRDTLSDDDALEPTEATGAVRVAHLSPDAPTVDIVTENGTVLAEDLSAQTHSEYVTVPSGTHTLEIRRAVQDDVPGELPVDTETTTSPEETDDVTETATPAEATDVEVGSGELLATTTVTVENGTAYSVMAASLAAPADDTETDDETTEMNETETEMDDGTTEMNQTQTEMDDEAEMNDTMTGLDEPETGVFVVEDATITISLPSESNPTDDGMETDGETNQTVAEPVA